MLSTGNDAGGDVTAQHGGAERVKDRVCVEHVFSFTCVSAALGHLRASAFSGCQERRGHRQGSREGTLEEAPEPPPLHHPVQQPLPFNRFLRRHRTTPKQ